MVFQDLESLQEKLLSDARAKCECVGQFLWTIKAHYFLENIGTASSIWFRIKIEKAKIFTFEKER